jgi:hypothetical protein
VIAERIIGRIFVAPVLTKGLLELVDAPLELRRRMRRPRRDRHGEQDARECGVHAGVVHCKPQKDAGQRVGQRMTHATAVEQYQDREQRGSGAERPELQVGRVEDGDD